MNHRRQLEIDAGYRQSSRWHERKPVIDYRDLDMEAAIKKENQQMTISAEQYYSDQLGDVPLLSQSTANLLLQKSPYHAWESHPKLGGKDRKPTAAMTNGTIIHALVSGDESGLQIIDAPDFRTKESQRLRDEAIELGLAPVLACKVDEMRVAAETIRSQAIRFGYDLPSYHNERTVLWDEGPTKCKARLDFYDGDCLIIDLKTTADASVDKCIRTICDNGYDVQAAAYIRAIESEFPDTTGRIRFVNLFAEIEAPYLVTPVEMDESFLTIGRSKWQRAIEIWQRCLNTNHWPGYTEKTVKVMAPSWYVSREMEQSAIHYTGGGLDG